MKKYIVFKETWDYIDDNYKSVSKREELVNVKIENRKIIIEGA